MLQLFHGPKSHLLPHYISCHSAELLPSFFLHDGLFNSASLVRPERLVSHAVVDHTVARFVCLVEASYLVLKVTESCQSLAHVVVEFPLG